MSCQYMKDLLKALKNGSWTEADVMKVLAVTTHYQQQESRESVNGGFRSVV